MKSYPCEKCGTRHRPSRHHILPRVFWSGYGGICWLCVCHHREIEEHIKQAEAKARGFHSAYRFKLHAYEYRKILKTFLEENQYERTR